MPSKMTSNMLKGLVLCLCFATQYSHGAPISPQHVEPKPTETSPYDLYNILIEVSHSLSVDEKQLYDNYKIERLQDPDIIIPPLPIFKVEGLPDFKELTITKRLNMTEKSLLTTHRYNLAVYKDAIEEVLLDEELSTSPTNFHLELTNTKQLIKYVLTRLDSVIYQLNYDNPKQPTPLPILFEDQPNESLRNLRDLYILQELYMYLPKILQDFPRLQKSHAPTDPQPTSPAPLTDIFEMYSRLVDESKALYHLENQVADDYKEDRFGEGNIDPDLDIPGLPDMSMLPPITRKQMSEAQLLQTHRTNLYAYKQAMAFVISDESDSGSPNDFTNDFETVVALTTRVLVKEERLMTVLKLKMSPPPQMVVLKPEENEVLRNLRDLQILQEMNQYLYKILIDFARLQASHE